MRVVLFVYGQCLHDYAKTHEKTKHNPYTESFLKPKKELLRPRDRRVNVQTHERQTLIRGEPIGNGGKLAVLSVSQKQKKKKR